MTEESFGWVAENSCLYLIFDSVWVRLYKLSVVVGCDHLKWGVGIGVDECLGQLGVGLVPFELERRQVDNRQIHIKFSDFIPQIIYEFGDLWSSTVSWSSVLMFFYSSKFFLCLSIPEKYIKNFWPCLGIFVSLQNI